MAKLKQRVKAGKLHPEDALASLSSPPDKLVRWLRSKATLRRYEEAVTRAWEDSIPKN